MYGQFKMRFTKTSHHATLLIPTKAEKVRRFIEVLNFGINIAMARKAKTGTMFLQAVEINHIIDCIQGHNREAMVMRGKRSHLLAVSVVPYLEVGIIMGEAILKGQFLQLIFPLVPVQSSFGELLAQSSYPTPLSHGSSSRNS